MAKYVKTYPCKILIQQWIDNIELIMFGLLVTFMIIRINVFLFDHEIFKHHFRFNFNIVIGCFHNLFWIFLVTIKDVKIWWHFKPILKIQNFPLLNLSNTQNNLIWWLIHFGKTGKNRTVKTCLLTLKNVWKFLHHNHQTYHSQSKFCKMLRTYIHSTYIHICLSLKLTQWWMQKVNLFKSSRSDHRWLRLKKWN